MRMEGIVPWLMADGIGLMGTRHPALRHQPSAMLGLAVLDLKERNRASADRAPMSASFLPPKMAPRPGGLTSLRLNRSHRR
jgi:hypothetical protein